MKKLWQKALAVCMAVAFILGLTVPLARAAGETTLGSQDVGNIVKLKENGTWADYIIIQQGTPDGYDSSCNGTWLLRDNIISSQYWEEPGGGGNGQYITSTLNNYISHTVLNSFDTNIKRSLKTVTLPYHDGRSPSTKSMCFKVFLLSPAEVGIDGRSYLRQGPALEFFTTNSTRIARNSEGTACTWWLRESFRVEEDDGYYYYEQTSVNYFGGFKVSTSTRDEYGVRPAIVLPDDITVTSDGAVTGNTAPTTPESITIPSPVYGGETKAVSWAASTDAENNLTGYRLERSVDGGAWSQIYEGAETSFTDNITYGWSTVYYRVKAYDSEGLESSTKTSTAISIVNIAGYTVEHCRQNTGDNGYTLYETEPLQGPAGTVTTASAKTYSGFHENTSAENRVASGQINLDGNLVLRLYYDRDTYTVTFESNGGNTVPSQNRIRYEGLVLKPIDPSKVGYNFGNWYSDEDLTAAYDFSTPLTGNLTLYADWIPRTDTAYRVEHYRQNVGDDDYTLYETDELQGTTDAMVTASAKTYTGFHENTVAPDRAAIGAVAPDGSLVLQLYYDRDTYNVTFDANGGSAVQPQTEIRYQAQIAKPPEPTKTGYDFGGWYSDVSRTSPYNFFSPVVQDLTLYAKWEPRDDTAYQVEHYQQNVGDAGYTRYETDELQGTTDAVVTASAKSYTGFHENTGVAGRVASGAVAPDGSLVFRLYYDRDIYTVTFDANGGELEASALSVTYGHTYGTLPVPVRTDYKFVGWYTGEDGGVNVTEDSTVADGGDRTLFAQWVEESFGVVDGIVVDSDGVPVPNASITIKAGNVDYKNTTTDSEGKFTILNVKYGTYNLVAEKDGVTVTVIFDIQAEKVSQTITLPRGKTNSVVDVLGDTPKLVVGGLNTLFDSSEIYTSSDETVVAGGGTVELRMTVEEKDAAALGEDGTKIALAASGMTPLYLDVHLTKNVISGDGQAVSTTLTELPQLLDIFIPLRESNAEGCRIFRVHNGVTDEITEIPNEYGEYFEIQGTSIIVHAKRFSTYAVATPVRSSGTDRYSITASAGAGGMVTPESASVSSGESKTIQIIPDEGHAILSVTVDGQKVDTVGSYTFDNVHRDHKLTVTFLCPSLAYDDLDTGSWYHTAVDVMLSKGYMFGTSGARWEPNGLMTRAQMAAILARVEGEETENTIETRFQDVDRNAWYAEPINWAAAHQVGLGYGSNMFGPNDTLTREQFALMLYRYAGEPDSQAVDLSEFFDWSHISPWAQDAVLWAVNAGILQGNEQKLLSPQGTCTRAQAATIMYRFLKGNE